ncbi:MAG: SurA N-terminal domain-containing protein [Fimbriimonadaceae bacterium]
MRILRISLLALAALSAVSLVGCNRSKADKSIAVVGTEKITLDEFNKYMAAKPTIRVVVQGEVVELPVAETIAFQALQDLISRKALFQMAKDEGVMPTDKQVDDEVGFQKKLNPEFVQQYQARGMGNPQIRDEIRFNLAQERLFTKGISVSDDEVQKWVEANPQAFVDPAKATLSVVLVKDATQQAKVDKALENGRPFREVAVDNSTMRDAKVNQGKFNSGRPVPIRSLAPVVREAVDKVQPRQTTGWVKLPEGMAKFYVDSKTDDIELEKTPERMANVKRSLGIEKGKLANDLRQRLLKRIRETDIEIVGSDAYNTAWKRFVEMLNAQAAAENAGSGLGLPGGTGATSRATSGATSGNAATPEGN